MWRHTGWDAANVAESVRCAFGRLRDTRLVEMQLGGGSLFDEVAAACRRDTDGTLESSVHGDFWEHAFSKRVDQGVCAHTQLKVDKQPSGTVSACFRTTGGPEADTEVRVWLPDGRWEGVYVFAVNSLARREVHADELPGGFVLQVTREHAVRVGSAIAGKEVIRGVAQFEFLNIRWDGSVRSFDLACADGTPLPFGASAWPGPRADPKVVLAVILAEAHALASLVLAMEAQCWPRSDWVRRRDFLAGIVRRTAPRIPNDANVLLDPRLARTSGTRPHHVCSPFAALVAFFL